MPSRQQEGPPIASFIRRDILLRAFFIALALGSVLTIANQSGAIFGDDTIQVLPIVPVYLTPFVVITVSQVPGLRRATLDARSPRSFERHDAAFFATAMSHGIPRRALSVALVIGTTNTSIVASSALMTTGSPSSLPTALIAQAFVLPMLLCLLSQTISYRRAMSAIGQQLQSALNSGNHQLQHANQGNITMTEFTNHTVESAPPASKALLESVKPPSTGPLNWWFSRLFLAPVRAC